MQYASSGDPWETREDGLRVVRWTAASGGATLVRLRLTNEGEETKVARIVEALPEPATNAVLITTTDDTPDSWRRTGDHVVHEFVVPAGGKRTTAYLLRSEDEPPLSLEAPVVETVSDVPDGEVDDVGDVLEPLEASSDFGDDATTDPFPRRTSPGAGRRTRSTATDQTDVNTHEENDVNTHEENGVNTHEEVDEVDRETRRVEEAIAKREGKSSSDDSAGDTAASPDNSSETADERRTDGEADSIVDELLVALEEDATMAQRRALRSKLGASESERTRLNHVQSRLEEMAAYVDAFEDVIDVYGVDVVDDMTDSIDENATTLAALQTDVQTIEDDVEQHREEVMESMEALENEMTAIWSGLSDRLETLESELNATRSTLDALEEDVENDRQARAREVRRFDQSISDIDDALDRLEADVAENDAFRRRFTAAFTSTPSVPDEDDESTGPVEHDPDSRTD